MSAKTYCAECGRAVEAGARCPAHPQSLRMPPGYIKKQFEAMQASVAAAVNRGMHYHTATTWENSFSREGGGGQLVAAINELRAEIADLNNLTPMPAEIPAQKTWAKSKSSSGSQKAVW